MVNVDPLDALRAELRQQCSFREIAAVLVARTPLKMAQFIRVKRSDTTHTMFGGQGCEPRPWGNGPTFPGWTGSLRWVVPTDETWVGRNLISALGMIYGDPNMLMAVNRTTNTFTQDVALFAADFPGMWMADRLRGRCEV